MSLHNPDLILMDLSMPGLDGWQTSELIRRRIGSSAPIIVISANAFADDLERSLGAQCNDYLAKPVHTPSLLAKIEHHLQLDWVKREPTPTRSARPRSPPCATCRS